MAVVQQANPAGSGTGSRVENTTSVEVSPAEVEVLVVHSSLPSTSAVHVCVTVLQTLLLQLVDVDVVVGDAHHHGAPWTSRPSAGWTVTGCGARGARGRAAGASAAVAAVGGEAGEP